MCMSDAKSAVASVIAVLLLTSCTGGSAPTAQQSQLRGGKQQSSRPCLYATNDPYFKSVTGSRGGCKRRRDADPGYHR